MQQEGIGEPRLLMHDALMRCTSWCEQTKDCALPESCQLVLSARECHGRVLPLVPQPVPAQ